MIPKIIHQTWKNNNIPGKWKNYHNTWKEKFPEPEFKHILWTDEDNRNLIKNNYSWFLDIYDKYPKNIQRADAVRYFILYHYGGIYADLDCEVRTNFYSYLAQDKINLAESPYKEKNTMNNLMASNRGNEIWKKIFQNLKDKKNLEGTIESTGPGVLNILNKDDYRLLDYNNYNPLKKRSFIRHHIENNFFLKLDNNKSKNWDNAYVVHHGTESWAEEEIKYKIWNNLFKYTFFIILISVIFYLIYKKNEL